MELSKTVGIWNQDKHAKGATIKNVTITFQV